MNQQLAKYILIITIFDNVKLGNQVPSLLPPLIKNQLIIGGSYLFYNLIGQSATVFLTAEGNQSKIGKISIYI